MKVLLLPLALLFFTGAQGRYFWQQDEHKRENSLQKIFQNAVAIVTDVVKNLEYSEIAKEFQIAEKLQAAKDNTDQLERVIEDYLDEIWKKWDEELHAQVPVFRTKVVPILEKFEDKLEDLLEKFVKEVVPIGSELFDGITKHVTSFLENVETVAEKGWERIHAEIDVLRDKLEPYVGDIRAEYEKYSKEITDANKWIEKVQEKVNALRRHAKHYMKNVKKYGDPNVEAFWKKLDKLLKKLYISNN